MQKKINKMVDILENVKATNIKVYDYENKSPFFDYVIVATATDRQSNAAVGYMKKEELADVKNVEGRDNSGWVLIDAKDIIIHLFTEDARITYGFDERLLAIKQLEIK